MRDKFNYTARDRFRSSDPFARFGRLKKKKNRKTRSDLQRGKLDIYFFLFTVRYAVHNISFVLQILYKITVDHGEVIMLTVTPTPTIHESCTPLARVHTRRHTYAPDKHTSKTQRRQTDRQADRQTDLRTKSVNLRTRKSKRT